MDACTTRACCGKGIENKTIILPGTDDHATPWKFYNHLIGQIPDDILVLDCCVGTHWTYVQAQSGMGISYTMTGGAKPNYAGPLTGLRLRDVAELAKSWNFREASIGVAALNAWYSQPEKLLSLGALLDDGSPEADAIAFNPFKALREQIAGKRVTVIGHFPNTESLEDQCLLTILERNCRSLNDTPDSACEYLLQSQDYIFTTGTSVINKTAPRLLDLGKNACFVMLGPSVIASAFLFKWGVDVLAGRFVADAQLAKASVKEGQRFGEAVKMFYLAKDAAKSN